MIQVRKAEDRGHFDYGWLNTRHTFSFDQYYDPEFNPSETELDHFYQIWIVPEQRGLRPSYDQRAFPEEEERGRLRVVASPPGVRSRMRATNRPAPRS